MFVRLQRGESVQNFNVWVYKELTDLIKKLNGRKRPNYAGQDACHTTFCPPPHNYCSLLNTFVFGVNFKCLIFSKINAGMLFGKAEAQPLAYLHHAKKPAQSRLS